MIDVKELRIGNFVYLPSLSKAAYGYENVPFCVEELFTEDGGYKVLCHCETKEGYNCTEDAIISEIEPIPLTEELLLKCGFKKTGDFAFEYKDDADLIFDAPNDWNNTDDYPVGISSIDPGYLAMYIPHGEVIIRCLYLHDLQNKFFAITGKELEVEL